MRHLFILFLAVGFVLIPQAILASPPIADPYLSTATISYSGPGMVTLLVVPDGSGPPFTKARDPDGNAVDATITLILRDGAGDATTMWGYPNEDLWLEFTDGVHLPTCALLERGLIADEFTDDMGTTHWINPPLAGGYNEGPTFVFVNGSPLQAPGLPIRFNSPDINGDLTVSLTDVGIFAGDYYSGYQFRSDMNADGKLNLTDIAIFAGFYGISCP